MDGDAAEAAAAAELVRRIAAGDAAGERALVERYSRGLLFSFGASPGGRNLAEDLHRRLSGW